MRTPEHANAGPPDADAPPAGRHQLARRLAVTIAALLVVLIAGVGYFVFRRQATHIREDVSRQLLHTEEMIELKFRGAMEGFARDIRYVSRLAPLTDFVARPEPSLRAPVEEAFVSLLETTPAYFQMRLIDARPAGTGLELIRVERNRDGSVAPTAPSGLQNKRDRDYFQEALAAPEAEFLVSRIDLNREHGAISEPHIPTLRLSSRLLDPEGRLFGIVVINIDLTRHFRELGRLAGPDTMLYLADEDGDFLIHPEPGRAFGFDLGRRHTIQDAIGRPVASLGFNEAVSIDFDAGTGRSGPVLAAFRRFSILEGSGRDVILGLTLRESAIYAAVDEARRQGIILSLMAAVLAVGCAFVLARALSRRLEALADTIARYEPGRPVPVPPEDAGHDEVALLGRKFAEMGRRIDEQMRRLAEARDLAEADSLEKERFLATVSHEIRTPLNAVITMAEALTSEMMPATDRRRLDTLLFSARQLRALLDGLLDLSCLEAGQLAFQRRPFDPASTVRAACDGFRATASSKGLEFAFTLDPALPPRVLADPVRVVQIIQNLVSNSVKFTRSGSVAVHVALIGRDPAGQGDGDGRDAGTDAGSQLECRVSDTGPGLSDADLERLFQPFARIDRPHDGAMPAGSGLGLSITRRLVEAMGGNLTIQSETGVGSTFIMRIPATPVDSASPVPAAAPLPRAHRLPEARILSVEDDAFNREVVDVLLHDSGVSVDHAESIAEARAMLAAFPYPAVLLDVQLPDGDGIALAGEIRIRFPGIPIILVTAGAHPGLHRECAAAGIDPDIVTKPVDRDALFDALAAALGGAPLHSGSAPRAGGAHRREPAAGDADRGRDVPCFDALNEVFGPRSPRLGEALTLCLREIETTASTLDQPTAGAWRRQIHKVRNALLTLGCHSLDDALQRLVEGGDEDPANGRGTNGSPWPELRRRLDDLADRLREAIAQCEVPAARTERDPDTVVN